jgi:hypothetical protein
MTASNMRTCSIANAYRCRGYTDVKTEHCRIGRDNRTLVRFFPHFPYPSPFHPQNKGKIVELSDVFFVPDVRMNGASFAPNRMSIRRTVWPQLTTRTHIHTYGHTHQVTVKADHFIEMICQKCINISRNALSSRI